MIVTRILNPTPPDSREWTPQRIVQEILDEKASLTKDGVPGPYLLKFSSAWREYLNRQYAEPMGVLTLLDRLREIDKVIYIHISDKLIGWTVEIYASLD